MRLRRRLALVLAATTSLSVATALGVTLGLFRRAQERALDTSLRAHALVDAEAAYRLGRAILELDHAAHAGHGEAVALDQLVTYRAIYWGDDRPVVASPAPWPPPRLEGLGFRPGGPLPPGPFDLRLAGRLWRATLARIGPPEDPRGLLLLAAPRGDLDADSGFLLRVMAVVLISAVALSLLLASLLGRRLTRGIAAVVQVARRVSEGELDARVADDAAARDDEMRALAADLNRMIDRLAALIGAGNRFVSNAAHELRSPLAALRGELELALRHPRSAEGLRAAITEALEDVDRLACLSEDLLALARTGIAREDASSALREVVAEAVRASRGGAEAGRVIVEVDDLRVRGRMTDLARMVRNLLDNALAHAPPDTAVRLAVRRDGDRALLAVEDEGPGVPPAIRERIFEPFFRGDAERGGPGAGLGLAIAREIARAQGGDLYLDGLDGPGGGAAVTRFVAVLELSADPDPVEPR